MPNKNILKFKKAVHRFKTELKSDPERKPYMGGGYHCPVCNTDVAWFEPISNDYMAELDRYEFNYALAHMETFNFLKYLCPYCKANDRDRLYALYFLKNLDKLNPNKKSDLVDFAPSFSLSDFFRKTGKFNYRTADLNMDHVDDKVDLTDMKIYKDGSFDVFVCSHVLEHVDDDRKAMRELYRILRPGGWGIAMVPIWTKGEDVLEDPSITSEADRWKYYGQGDHSRLYNRSGFVGRLTAAGFKVKVLGKDYFGAEAFEKHGIHPRSILYIAEKS